MRTNYNQTNRARKQPYPNTTGSSSKPAYLREDSHKNQVIKILKTDRYEAKKWLDREDSTFDFADHSLNESWKKLSNDEKTEVENIFKGFNSEKWDHVQVNNNGFRGIFNKKHYDYKSHRVINEKIRDYYEFSQREKGILDEIMRMVTSYIDKAKSSQEIEGILDILKQNEISIHITHYNVAIKKFGKFCDNKSLNELLKHMEYQKITFDIYTYNSLIQANTSYFKNKETTLDFIDKMLNSGLTLNTINYNIAMQAYATFKEPDGAFNVFNRIKSPEGSIYILLISACSVDENKFEEALALWSQIKNLNPADLLTVATPLISGCLRFRQHNKAKEIIDHILESSEKSHLDLDKEFYSAAISTYSELGLIDEGISMINKGIKSGIFKKTPGYNEKAKTLNFHNEEIYSEKNLGDKIHKGISLGVAKILVYYHLNKIKKGLIDNLITGYNGETLLIGIQKFFIQENQELKHFKLKVDAHNKGKLNISKT